MSIFEDIADDKLQLERRRLSATLASASSSSPASVTDPVSRVNTITKFATDIVRFEQRLALVFFSASLAFKFNNVCSFIRDSRDRWIEPRTLSDRTAVIFSFQFISIYLVRNFIYKFFYFKDLHLLRN